ncbi:MAG: 50S ribosomal protein L24 [Acidobacteria bacterium]|jgi:large subunit ribosomal protein L24|nr:50S ribosomal protein L24 [Acidobacteriota bacterium]|tara:strand:+ start:167 stop:499 length:333 start_codon:yes stop_codon:yes gene_type:complete
MPRRINIRKNDQVYVISGKDRGKTGRVMLVLPREEKVLVEGVNMVKKAVKSNPQKNVKGGLVESERPLHISNVAIVCPETNAPSRVRRKTLQDGSRVRVAAKSGATLDKV